MQSHYTGGAAPSTVGVAPPLEPPTSVAASQPGVMPPSHAITSVPLFSAPTSAPSAGSAGPLLSLPSLSELESLAAPSGPLPLQATAAKASPLILSSALPPIPAKVVDRIRAGSFVDLKELLPDNMALLQRLQETSTGPQAASGSSSRMREIRDPLTWAACFMGFVAARADLPGTRDLLAYGQLILQLARQHGGGGWIAYDSQFRQQAAAGASAPWSELNLSLMAATVFAAGGEAPARACQLCFATDHTARDCALASLEGGRTTQRPPSGAQASPRPRPYRARDEICRRFNRGTCSASACRFEHICSACQKPGHGSVDCKKGSSKGTPTEPPSR